MKSKGATFPSRLCEILAEESNWKTISWDADGTSFSIHNVKNFESAVLPLYFRHSRFQSFVRQLNMYHFHKLRNSQAGSLCFQNPDFVRGNAQNHLLTRKFPNKGTCKRQSISTTASQQQLYKGFPDEATGSLPSMSQLEQQSEQMEKVEADSQLIDRLVEEVRSKDLLLDCDVEAEVQARLHSEPYRAINRQFLPSILEQLGVEMGHNDLFRKLSFRTEELLAADLPLPSMKLII